MALRVSLLVIACVLAGLTLAHHAWLAVAVAGLSLAAVLAAHARQTRRRLSGQLRSVAASSDRLGAEAAVNRAMSQVHRPLATRIDQALAGVREALGADALMMVAARPGGLGGAWVVASGAPDGAVRRAEALRAAGASPERVARDAMRDLHGNCSVLPLGSSPPVAFLALGSRGKLPVANLVGVGAAARSLAQALVAAAAAPGGSRFPTTQPFASIDTKVARPSRAKALVRTLRLPLSFGKSRQAESSRPLH